MAVLRNTAIGLGPCADATNIAAARRYHVYRPDNGSQTVFDADTQTMSSRQAR
jgi:hypothetical protein